MKNIIFGLMLLGLSLNSWSETLRVENDTDDFLWVRAMFNDGTDCVGDEYLTSCIAPHSTVNITSSRRPVNLSVWLKGMGCSLTGPASWAHNPDLGCTAAPVSNIDPYTITWLGLLGGIWDVKITF